MDVAFNLSSKTASLGMVIRDSSGRVRLCVATKIDRVYLLLHAEIKAILFGLEIAWTNSFTSLIVESDSLVAIQ